MDSFFLGVLSSIWLGILTSISPCPLATNIAAISFIGKRLTNPKMVFWAGMIYMLGRILAYTVLAVIIVKSLMSIYEMAGFLDNYINKALGPILIVAGIFLMGWIKFSFSGGGISERLQKKIESYGLWGAGILGIIFAVSFCPISAALFFGSLIPLAIKYDSSLTLPSLYGLGTGLPVMLFALMLALGTRYVGLFFNKLSQIEKWARRITGIVFITVGIYYTLIYIFGIDLFN